MHVNLICFSIYIDGSSGGLDARVAPEVCAGGGAAWDRQGRAVPHPGDHGNPVPHSPQHCQPPSGVWIDHLSPCLITTPSSDAFNLRHIFDRSSYLFILYKMYDKNKKQQHLKWDRVSILIYSFDYQGSYMYYTCV
jgi:hypothetical protein